MEEFNEIQTHEHNGRDSKRLKGKNLENAPQAALTAQSGSISTSSTGSFVTAGSAATIENAITRIGEIETRLRNLGLIK